MILVLDSYRFEGALGLALICDTCIIQGTTRKLHWYNLPWAWFHGVGNDFLMLK
jgi:hypothetical protein